MRTLIAIPVYNEQVYVTTVLDEVRKYASDILVIDDGSTDDTPVLLAGQPVEVIRHARNRGYGQCMIDAFRWAGCYGFDWLVTMDCDEQHEPRSLPDFYRAIETDRADVISGSRYLCEQGHESDLPPEDRRKINTTMTRGFNECLKLSITDGFCGFKAYRVSAVRGMELDERGYAFPVQFWVQAVARGLRIEEIPIRLIYKDPTRSFGGPLDDPQQRLDYYQSVFERELRKFPDRFTTPCCSGCVSEKVDDKDKSAKPSGVETPVTTGRG